MKKYIFIASVLFVNMQAMAQISIEGGLLYGGYNMYELKRYQREIIQLEELIPVAKVESFPYFWSYMVAVNNDFEKKSFGVVLNLSSTGGRLFYGDFSGSVKYDQKIQRIGLGVNFIPTTIAVSQKFEFNPKITALTDFSFLQLSSEVILGSDSQSQSFSFRSTGISVETFLEFNYLIRENIKFGLTGGYGITVLARDFVFSDNSDIILASPAGGPIKPNWSGLRVGLVLKILLHK